MDTHGIREGAVFFIFFIIFHTLFLSHFIFVILFLSFYFILFLFLIAIDILMFVLVRKRLLLVFDKCLLCSSLRDALAFAHYDFLIPRYCISWHIGDNVSFKFGGMEKHTVFLFVLFVFIGKKKKTTMLLLSMSYTVTMVYISWACLTSWTHHVSRTNFCWLKETSYVLSWLSHAY